MPEVFVSYKKSDKDRVRPLVENLRAAGLDVWWDEGIAPSMSWRAEIANNLKAARCVVAVWTEDSVDHEQGRWVMEEANHGLARGVLAPVRLDLVPPPLGFGEVQYADLAAWNGKADDPRFQHFLGVVQSIVRAEPIAAGPTPTQFEAPGIKMQNVTLENVRIEVVERRAEDDDGEEAESAPASVQERNHRRAVAAPSMFLARLAGVVLPIAAIIFFLLNMSNQACRAGAAPGAFCQALHSLTSPAKPN